MAVRWYVTCLLSYRNIEVLMAEQNVEVDHAALNRGVVEYSPKLEIELGFWRSSAMIIVVV